MTGFTDSAQRRSTICHSIFFCAKFSTSSDEKNFLKIITYKEINRIKSVLKHFNLVQFV